MHVGLSTAFDAVVIDLDAVAARDQIVDGEPPVLVGDRAAGRAERAPRASTVGAAVEQVKQHTKSLFERLFGR